jgi:hypothetical protein
VDSGQAHKVVVASMAATAVIVIAAEAGRSHALPSVRTLGGLGLGFLVLSVAADLTPQVAGPLAILVLTTSLVVPPKGGAQSAGQVFFGAFEQKGPTTNG